MPSEIETKYETDEDTALPGLGELPGVREIDGPAEQRLQAEYYDTADLRLLRSGITLRRRQGGNDAGWHLKLPIGPDSREEIRLPLGRTGRRVPAELASLVRARTRGEALAPVAMITTTRRTTTLLNGDGEPLAEVADDHVRGIPTTDAASGPVEWHEVEVELAAGDRRLLRAADKLLRRAGLHRSSRSAKLERVLAEQLPERPAQGGGLAAHPAAADVVTRYLREHADRLVNLDPLVRRGEPDAVHQMRVATRRLRSTLQAFRSVIPAADSAPVAAELKWLGAVLGAERDAEVQAARLRKHLRTTGADVLLGPVQARIQAHTAKAAATSHADVLAAINSERYSVLLDSLDDLITAEKTGTDADRRASVIVPRAVRRSYRRTGRRMRAAWRQPPGPGRDTALHEARKAAKRVRYAAEAAVPVGGRRAARFARRVKKVHSVLGDRQDTVVGRQVTRGLAVAAQLAGESAFTYGLFYGRDEAAADRLDSRARTTWRKVSRAGFKLRAS
jgi:CHAD domain-containing protein